MDEARMLVFQAWHTALFSRVKKLPPLGKALPSGHNGDTLAKREQKVAMFKSFFSAHKMNKEAQKRAGASS